MIVQKIPIVPNAMSIFTTSFNMLTLDTVQAEIRFEKSHVVLGQSATLILLAFGKSIPESSKSFDIESQNFRR